jgi:hypothetical protein
MEEYLMQLMKRCRADGTSRAVQHGVQSAAYAGTVALSVAVISSRFLGSSQLRQSGVVTTGRCAGPNPWAFEEISVTSGG